MNQPITARRQRAVLVDHSFHRTTRSTEFFHEILRAHYDTLALWDEAWNGKEPTSAPAINAAQPDLVVFFQVRLDRREMARIRCRNLIWIPMYDDGDFSPSGRTRNWERLRKACPHLRILHFSSNTQTFFDALGFPGLRVQYFPRRIATGPFADEPMRLYFWPRRPELGWPVLKALLGAHRPESILLRHAPDPGLQVSLPDAAEQKEYRVRLVEGWLEEDAYRDLLRPCNAMMAPRAREGIGQTMLEAMSSGLAVIAPDAPTMNEYIRHQQTGYLYDLSDPRPLEFSSLARIREAGAAEVQAGRRRWDAAQPDLIRWISSPATPSRSWRNWFRGR